MLRPIMHDKKYLIIDNLDILSCYGCMATGLGYFSLVICGGITTIEGMETGINEMKSASSAPFPVTA